MIRDGFLRQDEREELRALARDGLREARASRRANAIVNHGWRCGEGAALRQNRRSARLPHRGERCLAAAQRQAGPQRGVTDMPRPASDCEAIEVEIDRLRSPDLDELRTPWRVTFRSSPLPAFTKRLLAESKHPPAWDARLAPSTEDRGKNRMPPRGRVVGVL